MHTLKKTVLTVVDLEAKLKQREELLRVWQSNLAQAQEQIQRLNASILQASGAIIELKELINYLKEKETSPLKKEIAPVEVKNSDKN